LTAPGTTDGTTDGTTTATTDGTKDAAPGPLAGMRVLELASEHAASAAKMLGDLGADVVVVEPPGGHRSRRYGPFADDVESPEHSLWWWYYNTSKRGIVLDLDDPAGAARFRALAGEVDVVLEGEAPGRLATLGIDHPDVLGEHPGIVWVSVTPFGRTTSRAHEPATDLTLLAGGGPAWSCGYDDHTLPPVRGGGNQAFHIGSVFAVAATLTALLQREVSGRGQHVDVSMHAAANVTTEAGSYMWMVEESVVQRQTGRHAIPTISMPTQMLCADGLYVNTGFPPRHQREFEALIDWLEELGLTDECAEATLLQLGVERGGVSITEITTDDLAREIFGAGRETLCFIAERLSAEEFFLGGQRRGLPCGVVASPEEAFENPHFVARGFQVEVDHDVIGRSVRYPGAPFVASASPWRISRRAPHVGEHDAEILGG
jgi:crotonobetainyl-CoA:carnitine CoA-transferase CaiB-like acyl-CoA transferase